MRGSMRETWNTSNFIWNNDSKYFTAEASELGIPAGKIPLLITLISERTGEEKTFSLSFIEEGGCFRYQAVDLKFRRKCNGILIFND